MEFSMVRRCLSTTARAAMSASASAQRPVLVGPLHPVSNLRPVIYSAVRQTPGRAHPYSVTEFSDSGLDTATSSESNWQVAWALTENDRKSHLFWLDVRLPLPRFDRVSKVIHVLPTIM